jgi:hypothetical protein
VPEGQELQKMLTQFSGYNLNEGLYKPVLQRADQARRMNWPVPLHQNGIAVKRRFETDDLTLAMKMTEGYSCPSSTR